MKIYVKAYSWEPKFEGQWSEDEIALWKDIDWQARNFNEYPIEDDKISADIHIYGVSYSEIPPAAWRKIEFVKCLRANPIYPPYYKPILPTEVQEFLRDTSCVGPMFDGDSYNGYDIHNRYETQSLYNMLST